MNKKNGFSLISIIIVISIIAILSLSAQAVYAKGIAKARDASRISELQNIKMIINIEMMETGAIFANQAEFSGVLQKNGFSIHPHGDICYFIASIPAGDSPLGKIEYAVATWGETTSNFKHGKPGILAIGSTQVISNLTTVKTNEGDEDLPSRLGIQDFSCGDSIRMEKVERAFLGDPTFEVVN